MKKIQIGLVLMVLSFIANAQHSFRLYFTSAYKLGTYQGLGTGQFSSTFSSNFGTIFEKGSFSNYWSIPVSLAYRKTIKNKFYEIEVGNFISHKKIVDTFLNIKGTNIGDSTFYSFDKTTKHAELRLYHGKTIYRDYTKKGISVQAGMAALFIYDEQKTVYKYPNSYSYHDVGYRLVGQPTVDINNRLSKHFIITSGLQINLFSIGVNQSKIQNNPLILNGSSLGYDFDIPFSWRARVGVAVEL
jgi:hypothetical protein